ATLDPECPNTKLYTLGGSADRYPIGVADLVKKLKVQLDQDLDYNCTPIGLCGSSGVPFKITCATFGYTVVGKGTTSRLWGEVSREADVYREIRSFGVVHQDLRPDNILWNAELERALIIDFHLCTLDRLPLHKRPGALKRLWRGPDERHSKRVRVV
ncbi:hypothetical protein N7512_009211, partial [Penicillium capsulatum]